MLQLRPYQEQLIHDVRMGLRSYQNVLAVAPTGAGKTALATFMLKSASEKGIDCWFIVHRNELLEQTTEAFGRIRLAHGIVAAGYDPSPMQRVQLCSIDTLRRRYKDMRPPGLIIFDECHHCVSKTWADLRRQFQAAKVVGLTATPERLDGRGLVEIFDHMALGPRVSWLINEGYLCDYKAFAPSMPNTKDLHTVAGDYNRRETSELMKKPKIIGDIVEHYIRHAQGRKAIGFAAGIENSIRMVQAFKEAGIRAWHLDGETPRGERQSIMTAFRRGDIEVLWNVDLFGEGVDVPDVGAVIDAAPTQSLCKFLQRCGRMLRPAEGKDHGIILDHAGNIMRHGLPCQDREWSLQGREKEKKGKGEKMQAIKRCPKCFAVHKPAAVCPFCGHEYTGAQRKLQHGEGQLEEVDKTKVVQKPADVDRVRARTLDDLISLGRQRGYKHPERWAAYVYTARLAKTKKPSPQNP